jgi:Uma2 family endonuclease
MSTVPVRTYTPEEYLALERAAEYKSEYFRGEIFAMAGAKLAHNLIAINLIQSLGNALREGNCRVLSSDMRTKCPTGLYTYPDASLVCGQPELEDDYIDTLLNPRVIFEILSPSTEAYDRGKKFEHYRSILSLQEYVLIAQDHAAVEKFVRPQDSDAWEWSVLNDLADSLTIGSCGARIRLVDIYAGINFPPPTIADVSPIRLFPDRMPPR